MGHRAQAAPEGEATMPTLLTTYGQNAVNAPSTHDASSAFFERRRRSGRRTGRHDPDGRDEEAPQRLTTMRRMRRWFGAGSNVAHGGGRPRRSAWLAASRNWPIQVETWDRSSPGVPQEGRPSCYTAILVFLRVAIILSRRAQYHGARSR